MLFIQTLLFSGSPGPPPPSDMPLLSTNISTPQELPLYPLLLNSFCFRRLHVCVESCVVYSEMPGLSEATQCSSGSSTRLLGTRSTPFCEAKSTPSCTWTTLSVSTPPPMDTLIASTPGLQGSGRASLPPTVISFPLKWFPEV